jgi:hypothetical protein
LAVLIVSEPKFVSGSEIALPAAALRASTMINKHPDRHKNLTHFPSERHNNHSLPKADDRLVDVNINNALSITTLPQRFANTCVSAR